MGKQGTKKGVSKPAPQLVNPKKIESPEQMWELFQDYKKHVKANPYKVHDFVGKDGLSVYREKEKPLNAFSFFTFIYYKIGLMGVQHYFSNTNNAYSDFKDVCNLILLEIKGEQIDGGMVGIYNGPLTARLNGLADKQETTVNAGENTIVKFEIKKRV